MVRFGVSGDLIPRDMDALTPAVAARVRALGFSGIFSRFGENDPHTTTRAQCERVRGILDDAGLQHYQCTGYWQCLIHSDETQRRAAVRTLQAALRIAGWLGARGIDTGPGSLSPRGPWFPHPGNWSATSRRQLVKSLQECAPVAEECGVILSLEGHQLVTLDCAETMRAVLDEVNSPMVKCDWDPVNWITLRTVYDTGRAMRQMVDVLRPYIVSAHAKDVVIEDRLVVHLDNVATGDGLLDYATFFQLMEALDPAYPIIVESASVAQLPAVKAVLDRTAQALGITVR
jgi:sugar phosphate isomerase/epimerase